MADGRVELNATSGGDKVDVTQFTRGAETISRQRVQTAGTTDGSEVDAYTSEPASNVYAHPTRPIGVLAALASLATESTLGAGFSAVLSALGSLAVTVSNFPATQPVSGAAASQADGHSANIGALADADTANTLTGLLKKVKALHAGGLPAALTAGGSLKVAINEAIAAGTALIGKITISDGTNDAAIKAASTAAVAADKALVVVVSPNNVVGVKMQAVSTALTSVSDSTSPVQLLAPNANRLGATFYNRSGAILYLRESNTTSTPQASVTDCTVAIKPGGTYELPMPVECGYIHGAWSSAPGAAVHITERRAT